MVFIIDNDQMLECPFQAHDPQWQLITPIISKTLLLNKVSCSSLYFTSQFRKWNQLFMFKNVSFCISRQCIAEGKGTDTLRGTSPTFSPTLTFEITPWWPLSDPVVSSQTPRWSLCGHPVTPPNDEGLGHTHHPLPLPQDSGMWRRQTDRVTSLLDTSKYNLVQLRWYNLG